MFPLLNCPLLVIIPPTKSPQETIELQLIARLELKRHFVIFKRRHSNLIWHIPLAMSLHFVAIPCADHNNNNNNNIIPVNPPHYCLSGNYLLARSARIHSPVQNIRVRWTQFAAYDNLIGSLSH